MTFSITRSQGIVFGAAGSVALFALLAGCALLPAGAPGVGSTQLDQPVVEVPMDLTTEHIAVEVFIGEQGPFVFNLDTYAVTTACVDLQFAARMGFKKVGKVTNGDGSGVTQERDVVMIPELRFGGAVFTDVRALADDYSWVATADGGAIDGLLGYHLFRDLLLELDYPGQRVRLSRGALDPDARYVVAHAALRDRPDFPLHVGAERITVGIDSGAMSSISLPASFVQKLKLVAPPTLVGRAKTVYSEADVLSGILAEPLVFAGNSVADVRASFSTLFGKPLIGHGLLVDYVVRFDQSNGRVQFVPPGPPVATR